MLIISFLHWWYGPGWHDAAQRLAGRIRQTLLTFSVPILLTTMFAPWRRIVTPPGGSIQQKLRGLLDNTVSRTVGFAVRLIALLTACGLVVIYAVGGGLLVLLWPVLPLLGPGLVVAGLF